MTAQSRRYSLGHLSLDSAEHEKHTKITSHLAKCRIESIGRLRLHVRRDLAVAVERHRDAGIAESFLDDPGMHPLCQEQRRARMPQVVEAQVRQAGFAGQRLELRHQHIDVQRLRLLPGEDESRIDPQLPQPETLRVLLRTVSPQEGDATFRQRDRATSTCRLRLTDHPVAGTAPAHRPPYRQHPPVEIFVLPHQSQQLTPQHAGQQRQSPERRVRAREVIHR